MITRINTRKRCRQRQLRPTSVSYIFEFSIASLLLCGVPLRKNVPVKATPIDGITVENIFDNADPNYPGNITVGVYYYPWHGGDFHRHAGYLRKFLQPDPQWPLLGEYDDRRPQVVAQHLLWSQQANVKLWVCSWWGPNSREDTTIRNVVLQHTDLRKDHKIALLYEGSGRGIKASDGWDTSKVYPDMEYICNAYFDHPNYHRIQNKPVVVIYLARQMYEKGVLNTVLRDMRLAAQDACQTELFLIGDHVWQSPPQVPDAFYAPFDTPGASLDAVTNYDVYGNVGSAPYATQHAIDEHYDRQRQWVLFTASKRVGYIPGTSPGYNDRGVRLSNNHTGLSRRLNADIDEAGTLFAAHLVQARQLVSNEMGNLLMVNSWNEWHEDSQIEPVQMNLNVISNMPDDLTNGLEYECYGTKYLDILRKGTCNGCPPIKMERFKGVILKPDPFSTKPPPESILVAALYYPYENDRSWFRNRLSTRQRIAMGDYAAITPAIVSQHLQYSRDANVGMWIVEWNGQTSQQDFLLQTQILNRDDLQHLRVSVFYHARGRVNQNTWDYSKVKTDMEYLFSTICTHNHYFSVQGRPVIFLSLTRWFHTQNQLQALVDVVRNAGSNHGFPRVYIVGDQIWNEVPPVALTYSPYQILDAVVNLDVYGNLESLSSLNGQDVVDAHYRRQRDWRDSAWQAGCGYVPSVMPGFNSRGFGSSNDIVSRELNDTTAPGSFFSSSLQKARYLVDSTLTGLVLVSSFNRFHEDTQIEPVVGKTTRDPSWLTSNTSYVGYGSLYLEILRDRTSIDSNETLEEDDVSPDPEELFSPLPCNADVDLSSCTTNWNDLFGNRGEHEQMVTIPCGACVVLDQNTNPTTTADLKLKDGLNILGVLYIRNVTSLVISTPFIRIQGEFHIDAPGSITGNPIVRFDFIEGNRLGNEKFIPASSNEYACGVERCDPGTKSIFVAGGRIVWNGLSPDINTHPWLSVVDVISSLEENETLPAMKHPMHCPTGGIMIEKNFVYTQEKQVEASVEVVHGTFAELQQQRTTYRSTGADSTNVDLTSIRDCLMATTYEFSLRVRLVNEMMVGSPAPCSVMGGNGGETCFEISIETMKENLNNQVSTLLWSGPSSNDDDDDDKTVTAITFGEWIHIHGNLTLTDQHLDPSHVYTSFRIRSSVNDGETLPEYDKFVLRQLQDDVCVRSSDHIDCRDLVTCNGHAEYPTTSYPFMGTGGQGFLVRLDETNDDDKDKNSYWHFEDGGMMWKVPSKCLLENAVYKLEMKLRSHPITVSSQDTTTTSGTNSSFVILTRTTTRKVTVAVYLKMGSQILEQVCVCTERKGEWTNCTGYVSIDTSSIVPNGTKDEFSMQIQRLHGGGYDIDDLSVQFWRMVHPVSDLVVSKVGVQANSWLPGAQVLISPSPYQLTASEEEETVEDSHIQSYPKLLRTVLAVRDHIDDDGENGGDYRVLSLDSPIPNPLLSVRQNDYDGLMSTTTIIRHQQPPSPQTLLQVTLTDRNIVVNDGYLTVYRTPSVSQTVKGVQFRYHDGDDDDDESTGGSTPTFFTERPPIHIYQSVSVNGTELVGNVIVVVDPIMNNVSNINVNNYNNSNSNMTNDDDDDDDMKGIIVVEDTTDLWILDNHFFVSNDSES